MTLTYYEDDGLRMVVNWRELSLLIEIADKAAVLEFAHKGGIDEVRRLGVLAALTERIDHELDAIQRGKLVARKFIVGDRNVVTFLGDLRVSVAPAGKMLGEYFEPGAAIGFHDVDGFDLRFDIAPNDVLLLAYEFFCRDNAVVLKRQVADIG
jgi:hypothetical protein